LGPSTICSRLSTAWISATTAATRRLRAASRLSPKSTIRSKSATTTTAAASTTSAWSPRRPVARLRNLVSLLSVYWNLISHNWRQMGGSKWLFYIQRLVKVAINRKKQISLHLLCHKQTWLSFSNQSLLCLFGKRRWNLSVLVDVPIGQRRLYKAFVEFFLSFHLLQRSWIRSS